MGFESSEDFMSKKASTVTGSALIFGFKLGFLAPCSDHQFFSNQRHQCYLIHPCSPPSLSINPGISRH